MKTQVTSIAILVLMASAAGWISPTRATPAQSDSQTMSARDSGSDLIAAARNASRKYLDVAAAISDGYVKSWGCVSGPMGGAMGIHYVNGAYVGDGTLDPRHPEVLVYEPLTHGKLQLVAVEYVVVADQWNAAHPDLVPPVILGQSPDYIATPNRYGLPALYALHVWAWKYNPMGAFSMWNPRVSCNYATE